MSIPTPPNGMVSNTELILRKILGEDVTPLPPNSRVEFYLVQVEEYIERLATGATRPIGETTTPLTDGATTNPITIDGESYTAQVNDLVFYQNKEFLFTANGWREVGDLTNLNADMIDDTNTTNKFATSEQLAQIATNETNILSKANTSDVNTATANLQAQINNIITPATQDAEVENARVGADGTSYQTLKARLDAEDISLNADIAEISETGNLILGKIEKTSVSQSGVITSENKTDLFYAKVKQGQTYAITSNESNIVIGYYNELPYYGLRSYNASRTITESGVYTVTAPITGYIAFRTLTGYAYAQIEKGTTKTPYKDYRITANDLVARSKLTDVSTLASDIAMFENVGFCGDSYMAGMIVVSENPTVTATNQNLCWGKILERTHGINASIFAKGGVKASDYISDTECLPALLEASAQQLYVISLGHNDAYDQTSVSSFKASYESILDSIIEHAPNAKIILCRQSRGYGDLNNGSELNEAISEIGEDYGLPVLNPENDIYLSSSIYTNTMVHRHPTFAGYAGMAKAFDRQFAKATVDYWDYFKGYTG